MSSQTEKSLKSRSVFIHILCWALVIVVPLFFRHPNDTTHEVIVRYLRSLGGPLSFLIVFYINYLWLVPKFYLNGRKREFCLINVAVILCALGFSQGWWTIADKILPSIEHHHRHRPSPPFFSPQLFYNTLLLALIVGLTVALRSAQRMTHLEEARAEAESMRTQAELANLRSQLNPHFLLNTLNNIYALIAFDSDKAQTAVDQLSRLLRHVLYENEQNFVPLYKEAAFMRNYVDLMKIRVTDNVKVDTNIDVADDDTTPIAPLIFISLVENAFKHGISPSGSGHISIDLHQNDGDIVCEIRNTNYPKRANDKSGSGIGLEQVARRLELMYPGRYVWTKGTNNDNTEYISKIEINHDN